MKVSGQCLRNPRKSPGSPGLNMVLLHGDRDMAISRDILGLELVVWGCLLLDHNGQRLGMLLIITVDRQHSITRTRPAVMLTMSGLKTILKNTLVNLILTGYFCLAYSLSSSKAVNYFTFLNGAFEYKNSWTTQINVFTP